MKCEELKALLTYDPETGLFVWNRRPLAAFKKVRDHSAWNTRYAGKPAGNIAPRGYITIRIYGRRYLAHRLAWLYMTDVWPKHVIDHIDRNSGNNRWANLRKATHKQNSRNSTKHKNNTSGFKGVYLYRDGIRWQASIRTDLGRKWLGIFESAEAAHAAYCVAVVDYHGEFGRGR